MSGGVNNMVKNKAMTVGWGVMDDGWCTELFMSWLI